MNSIEVKAHYHQLTVNEHIGRVKAIGIIIKDMVLDEIPENVIRIVAMPSKDEQRKFIKENNLWCDRCNTNEFIVAEPLCLDQSRIESKLTTKVEYYCNNPNTESTVFSRCWKHVYSYPNITGESIPKICTA